MPRSLTPDFVATIDAGDAHFWWQHEARKLIITKFGSTEDHRICENDAGLSDCGACESTWADLSDEERVRWMTEMVIEFLTFGFPADEVIGQFLKVRQFAELGAKSYMMSRTFFRHLEGKDMEGPELFAEKYLGRSA